MSLSAASKQTVASVASPFVSPTSTSSSNQITSTQNNFDLKNIGSIASSVVNYSTTDVSPNATSITSNSHHKNSQNSLYSTSPITNDVWMAALNQQMPLPNLTDAILDTDFFYPFVS